MSTIGLSSWAVDLKDVGAIYPFQGWEVPMVIAAVAFWVLWHVWQFSHESAELKEKSDRVDVKESRSAIERY
ncbi:MAG: hypothetical protein JSR78_14095 [Proteobacteria bacterium]|nr:hypothetical protein [Pseudomonadota bacterium]